MTPVNKRLLSKEEAEQLGMNFVEDINWRRLRCYTYVNGDSELNKLYIKISPTDVVDGFSMRCSFRPKNTFYDLYWVTKRNRAMFNDVSSFFTFLSNDAIWKKRVDDGVREVGCPIQYDGILAVKYYTQKKTKMVRVPEKYSFVYDSDYGCEMNMTVIYEFSDPKICLLYGLKGLVGGFSFDRTRLDYFIEGIQDNLCSPETVDVEDSMVISDMTSLFFDQQKTWNICEKIMDDYVKTQIWGKGLAL